MFLESLPTELLFMVLRFVEADRFRERLDLLTINKRWYEVARCVLLEDTRLSAKNLHLFPPESARLCELLKSNLKELTISLEGFEERSDTFFTLSAQLQLLLPSTDMTRNDRARERTEWLNRRLLDVANFATECRALKLVYLSVAIGWEQTPPLYKPRRSIFLYPAPLNNLLAPGVAHNLTELCIDMPDGSTVDPRQDHAYQHICPAIAKRIPTLRRLYLRMARICPEVLDLGEYTGPVALQKLNIQLSVLRLGSSSIEYSRSCEGEDLPLLPLRIAMVDAATRLAVRAPSAQIVRVVSRSIARDGIVVWDCLDSKRIRFHKGDVRNSVLETADESHSEEDEDDSMDEDDDFAEEDDDSMDEDDDFVDEADDSVDENDKSTQTSSMDTPGD